MGWGRHHGTFGVLGLGSVLSLSCMSTCAHTRAHAHTYTHSPFCNCFLGGPRRHICSAWGAGQGCKAESSPTLPVPGLAWAGYVTR